MHEVWSRFIAIRVPHVHHQEHQVVLQLLMDRLLRKLLEIWSKMRTRSEITDDVRLEKVKVLLVYKLILKLILMTFRLDAPVLKCEMKLDWMGIYFYRLSERAKCSKTN